MHHNHRAFDDRDPDASQALEDALPIVEALLLERAKPEPRGAEMRTAWHARVAEIRADLEGPAFRAGCTANELEELAIAEIRHRGARLPRQAPSFTAAIAPDLGIRELAQQEALLEKERADLLVQDQQLVARRNRIAARVSAIGKDLARLERRCRRRGRVLV